MNRSVRSLGQYKMTLRQVKKTKAANFLHLKVFQYRTVILCVTEKIIRALFQIQISPGKKLLHVMLSIEHQSQTDVNSNVKVQNKEEKAYVSRKAK